MTTAPADPPPTIAFGHRRNDLVDAFRGLSVLAVLLFHYATETLGQPEDGAFGLGARGVEVFFVISGFVITMTALRSRGAVDFLVRRFARIYPTFFVAATLTYLLLLLRPASPQHVGAMDYLTSLALLSQRLGYRYVDGAYWSLFVECQFYVLVALALRLLKARFWIGVLAVLLAGAAVRPLSRYLSLLLFADYSAFFLLGMAGWYALAERRRAPGLALALAAVAEYAISPRLAILWPAIPPALLMLALFGLGVNRKLGPFAWIGRISYPLYLIHEVPGVEAIRAMQGMGVPGPVASLVTAVGAIALAALFHHRIEEPAQRWIMARWKRRSPPAEPPVEPRAGERILE